ncbi:MAG TPA: AAA domain-containing protein [Pirellulales bacterium]|jgi:superfamily I DNA and/or RNA helicase|nr:AAA domain-containing protein [Pirellulales bacterium]
MDPTLIDDHFRRLARLLELEGQAEAERLVRRGRRLSAAEAEQSGNALIELVVTDEDAGLGGRYLLNFAKRRRTPLPWTRLGVGSPVLLSPETAQAARFARGVVCEKGEDLVRVALAEIPDDLGDHETWRIDLARDEIAGQRQRQALERARLARGNRLAELVHVLLGERAPSFAPTRNEPFVGSDPIDSESAKGPTCEGLNDVQREAVRFALSARDVALIHGPPGTGKTTTVVELIRCAVRRGQKVLACAPSNVAVDNLLERLVSAGERAVRLGHPARVLPELRAHSLDLLVEEHRDVRLARKLVKEALALFRKAGRYTRARPQPGARRQTREEARARLADARRLEGQAVEHILDQANVVCATTTGLDDELLGDRRFDLAVIDEACQSTEPGAWIPLLRADRVVLAGDHCQLPPTVISGEAAAQGFGVSLFERLMELYGREASRRLVVQYRMHEAIMDFSSREFYDAALLADPGVAAHRLADLPGVAAGPLTETPVEFVDTAGAGYDEQLEPDGESRFNPQEAELVVRRVEALVAAGLGAEAIAVIAPYSAQVRVLRERLGLPGLEVDSVDGFQGREREAVVISLVRSNATGEIGFLGEVRRLNVALTRARRKLIVIGDSATLSCDPFYRRLLDYFESLGAYHTVWEEP